MHNDTNVFFGGRTYFSRLSTTSDILNCSNNTWSPMQNLVMQHVDHSAGDFIDLLKCLLAYEPSARLTAEEALRHGFFTRHGNRRSL